MTPSTTDSLALAATIARRPPTTEFVYEAVVDIGERVSIGQAPLGERFIVPIIGGVFKGADIEGAVLPGGADWSVDRDGVATLDARYVLRADDGALIGITNRGFWRATPEVTARLDAGEPVDEREYYYRTSPVFTTESPAHRWLTETVFVGLAREDHGDVCIRFFALT